MGTKTYQLNDVLARLTIDAVDEDQIRLDVTITMVTPFSCQWVIAVPFGKRLVSSKQLKYILKIGFE